MLTKEYDFNVWGKDKDIIHLTAYRLFIDGSGDLSTNCDRDFVSLELNRHKDLRAIKYLVSLSGYFNDYYKDYMTEDYTDYDDWVSQKDLTKLRTPSKISKWVKNLPEYDMLDLTKLKENN
jgi:hypothetical protein